MTALGALVARGTMYPRFYFFLIGFAVLILVRGLVAFSQWMAAHWPGRPSARGVEGAMTGMLAAAIFAASGFALIQNYRYPKQDFEGAIRFVESARQAGDNVVTAGATTFPLSQYYEKPWKGVETADQLRALCRQSSAVWVVYTFPRYLAAAAPQVDEIIRKDFTVVRVFHGTVGDGDVFVARFQRV
jgi:mannosyltransferase